VLPANGAACVFHVVNTAVGLVYAQLYLLCVGYISAEGNAVGNAVRQVHSAGTAVGIGMVIPSAGKGKTVGICGLYHSFRVGGAVKGMAVYLHPVKVCGVKQFTALAVGVCLYHYSVHTLYKAVKLFLRKVENAGMLQHEFRRNSVYKNMTSFVHFGAYLYSKKHGNAKLLAYLPRFVEFINVSFCKGGIIAVFYIRLMVVVCKGNTVNSRSFCRFQYLSRGCLAAGAYAGRVSVKVYKHGVFPPFFSTLYYSTFFKIINSNALFKILLCRENIYAKMVKNRRLCKGDNVMELKMKMVSSLEKCFYSDKLESIKEKTDFIMFANERLSFQVAYRAKYSGFSIPQICNVKVGGELAKYARVRLVCNVLNMYPTYAEEPGGEFIKTEPGAYPDLIRPFFYPNAVSLPSGQTHALWVDIELPEGFGAGEYSITVGLYGNEEALCEVAGKVKVISVCLPKQKLIHTEWFYTDCIANYYHVKAFSEKHWKHIESFVSVAAQNGINMILTPVFTPELDTYIGGERLTTQLTDIELGEDGKYIFGFKKLDRWIDICLGCGIEYFEIPHFFTQWGAKAAPKITVKVKGKNKKYFGWHTDSLGAEYVSFLDQFIPALLAHFKRRGLDKKCFFHVSDEPSLNSLEHYTLCKNIIEKHLKDYPIIDALSNIEFYRSGALKKPVPSTKCAMPFVEENIPGLWVYYCGGGRCGASDRSIAMPSERTRILGIQLYYYNIEGFLHWGYNFYNTFRSYNCVDPYANPDGAYFTPAGDEFLVYPGTDGKAWPSLRLNALREAVDDIRALAAYEERFGREAAKQLILEGTDGTLTFTQYPKNREYLITLREKIAKALED